MKTHASVSIDSEVLQRVKAAGGNISAICEEELIGWLKKRERKASNAYARAWEKYAEEETAKKAEEDKRGLERRELECARKNRLLWNKAYRLLREQGWPSDDYWERARARIGLFERLLAEVEGKKSKKKKSREGK